MNACLPAVRVVAGSAATIDRYTLCNTTMHDGTHWPEPFKLLSKDANSHYFPPDLLSREPTGPMDTGSVCKIVAGGPGLLSDAFCPPQRALLIGAEGGGAVLDMRLPAALWLPYRCQSPVRVCRESKSSQTAALLQGK